jgi:type I restriction enzyme, S subunit
VTWQKTRLKFLAQRPIQNGLGESGGEANPDWPRYVRTTDIAGPRKLRDDVFASLPPEVAHKALLQPEDLLMTAAGATIGKSLLYLDNAPACYAGYLVRFRAGHGVDPRFVSYWTESLSYWDQIRAGRVVSTIENFSASRYKNLGLSVPPLATQRTIADYLDRETARLDTLVAAKQRMVELLEERWQEVLDTVIWSEVDGTTRVMHVVDLRRQVMYGIVLPGPDVGGDGIAIVKGGDVAQGRLSWEALCKTTPEIEAPYARARVRGGDLVFAIRGGIGDVAIVPDELTGANLTQDVARVAPRTGISSEWLMYALQSPTTQRDVRQRVTGATITGLNIWELDRVRLPLASPERQQRDLEQLTGEAEHFQAMRAALGRQTGLLEERREALITAAVTGQLDIPEAA